MEPSHKLIISKKSGKDYLLNSTIGNLYCHRNSSSLSLVPSKVVANLCGILSPSIMDHVSCIMHPVSCLAAYKLIIAILLMFTFSSGCAKRADYKNFYHEGRSLIRPGHESPAEYGSIYGRQYLQGFLGLRFCLCVNIPYHSSHASIAYSN